MHLKELLKYIDNENAILYLWHNIKNSNCDLCQLVYKKTIITGNLVGAIIETYQEQDYFLNFILGYFDKNNNIETLKLIATYINMYYDIIDKLIKVCFYPIIIFTILIFCMYFIYIYLNININYIVFIVIIFIIICYFIYHIVKIINRIKYILKISVVINLLENTINIKKFIELYIKITRNNPNIEKTDSAISLVKNLLNIDFISIQYIKEFLNKTIIQFNEYLNSIPESFFTILIICISIFMINILYFIYSDMSFVF